jgi:hypothetical protein
MHVKVQVAMKLSLPWYHSCLTNIIVVWLCSQLIQNVYLFVKKTQFSVDSEYNFGHFNWIITINL